MDSDRRTGANTLTLIPNFFQADKFSNTVELDLAINLGPARATPLSRSRNPFRRQGEGLRGGAQAPSRNRDPRVWRAEIAPTDPDAWFASYKAMMVGYAKAAQEGGAANDLRRHRDGEHDRPSSTIPHRRNGPILRRGE